MKLLLGIDLGTSFAKVSVVDAETGAGIVSVSNSGAEAAILSSQPGWAEQRPEQWWDTVRQVILQAHASKKYNPKDIVAIGIAYQMHGLVLVDKEQKVLRNSIIWCDSRAVEIGDKAFREIGEKKCLGTILNSPGNFTASKLAWVKEHEPDTYRRIHKIMLPGDFIAMKLTGEITTTPSALSEGMFWDFKKDRVSEEVLQYFTYAEELIPAVRPVFSEHGCLSGQIAEELHLKEGIPVSYKAGDQLNNALSLNVFKPGEIAATAGTSGVIYAVTDRPFYDEQSRVNSFAHVNHTREQKSLGVLLCINGCGIMNSWIKKLIAPTLSYEWMNEEAARIPAGSEGLAILPFGNGAERLFNNRMIGAHFLDLNLTVHQPAHLARAVQEGIVFAFRYGLDIMRDNGMELSVVRAGMANLFLSEVFVEAFCNSTGLEVELYKNDGSTGAALGAGMGAGVYKSTEEAFKNLRPLKTVRPCAALSPNYEKHYHQWKKQLLKYLK